MFKKITVTLFAIAFLVGVGSCGSSNNIKDVCQAVYDSMDEACDLSNPTEAAIVAATLTTLTGETVTAADVMATSEGEFLDECVAGFEEDGAEITDEAKTAMLTAIDQATSTDCATTMTSLGALLAL